MEKRKKLRVAAYIRVSTDENSSKWVSTIAQKRAILDFVNKNNDNYIINEKKNIYIDNWHSWATDKRPWFTKLMEDAFNKDFDIVIVWKLDRFFRKTTLLLSYVEKLDSLKISFKSLSESFDIVWWFWKMILWHLALMAEFERENILLRTITWRQTKAENWYYVWWWKTPLWYNKIKKWTWNVLEIDEKEAEIVKRVFDLFVNEKKSINEIARIFTDEQVQTKNIKKNDNLEKWKNSRWVWHAKTISELLKNTKYIWKYYYWKNGSEMNKENWKRVTFERPKDEWLMLECPRIIEDNIFNEAQILIEKNKVIKNNKISHTFTWLIRCSHCWKSYVWYRTSKKTISYKCNWSRREKMKWKELCKNEQVSELILFETIWNKLDYIFKNPKEVLEVYYDKEKEWNEVIRKLIKEEDNLNKTIDEKTKILEKMQEDYYLFEWIRKITQEKLIKKNEDKINNMYSRLEEVKERIKEFNNVKENTKNLIKLFNNYKEIYKNLTDEDKLDLIKEFVDKVEIDNNDINVIFKFSIKKKGKWWKNDKDKEKSNLKEKKTLIDSMKNAVTWNTIKNIN